jgi:hypothetical protein
MFEYIKNYLIRFLLVITALSPFYAIAGNIDFKDFNIQGNPSHFLVTTRVEFELTDYLRNALQNGVTLNAHVQFRLGKHRSWWFNKDTPLLTVKYQLKYHALSRHYLLTRNDTNENWNFSSLTATLRKLGELRRYSLPDISASIDSDEEYYIFAIADMVPATLDLPLRIQSIFSDQYRLTSEGVLWPLP